MPKNVVVVKQNLPETNYIFARHETFHPRFGWIKKGFDLANKTPEIFLLDEAPILLGVGKNMVNSIRYWCHAFKVLREDVDSGNRGRSSFATEFGTKLLGDEGWDTYLEDPASLWLLHWHLLSRPCMASSWYFLFNIFTLNDFDDNQLLDGLKRYASAKGNVAEGSLKKDISCMIRMYANNKNKSGPIEDSIDCPFTELGLIFNNDISHRFSFRFGVKTNLPPEVIVATCLEYAEITNAQTIAVSRLLYEEGSPGMVFKLTESALCDAIEIVSRQDSTISLSDSSGLLQFSFRGEASELSDNLLKNYYGSHI
ncbi:MAG: DUF4007 family protein [Cyanobacteriota bacterium]|jgi:hypothetical protein